MLIIIMLNYRVDFLSSSPQSFNSAQQKSGLDHNVGDHNLSISIILVVSCIVLFISESRCGWEVPWRARLVVSTRSWRPLKPHRQQTWDCWRTECCLPPPPCWPPGGWKRIWGRPGEGSETALRPKLLSLLLGSGFAGLSQGWLPAPSLEHDQFILLRLSQYWGRQSLVVLLPVI